MNNGIFYCRAVFINTPAICQILIAKLLAYYYKWTDQIHLQYIERMINISYVW